MLTPQNSEEGVFHLLAAVGGRSPECSPQLPVCLCDLLQDTGTNLQHNPIDARPNQSTTQLMHDPIKAQPK
jgi:hypothetical protein